MVQRKGWNTYTAYSLGCGVIWAVIWIIVAIAGSNHAHALLLVFAGWVIGWSSATIARAVYGRPMQPEPRPRP